MPRPLRIATTLAALWAAGGLAPTALRAQAPADERTVIAVADSMLRALSTNDTVTLARLSLDSTLVGGVGMRSGQQVLSLRSMRFDLARGFPRFIERGFNASARVNGWIAQVWMPYDLYREGQWSHCGVDTFTMMKVNGAWRVASLLFTIEQPPDCRPHPAGPPAP